MTKVADPLWDSSIIREDYPATAGRLHVSYVKDTGAAVAWDSAGAARVAVVSDDLLDAIDALVDRHRAKEFAECAERLAAGESVIPNRRHLRKWGDAAFRDLAAGRIGRGDLKCQPLPPGFEGAKLVHMETRGGCFEWAILSVPERDDWI